MKTLYSQKRVYEVHMPYHQTLVYFIEASSPEEAIEIAKTPGVIEDHSIGGATEKIKAFVRNDFKPKKL